MIKTINHQTEEAYQPPRKRHIKKPTRHIISKMLKNTSKENILKTSQREKTLDVEEQR